MILRLVVEASPAPQAEMERLFEGGRLVIGRSDDADWQLDDPTMYLSRRHCILTEEGGQIMATDASSGGLFIDNGANPIGTGNSVPVEPGMRLHMADFVLRIESVSASAPADSPARKSDNVGMAMSFEFGSAPPPEDPVERPKDLPDPFGLRKDDAPGKIDKEASRPPLPLDRHDPFGLDLRTPFGPDGDAKDTSAPIKPDVVFPPVGRDTGRETGRGGYFGSTGPEADDTNPPAEIDEKPAKPDIFGDWSAPAPPPRDAGLQSPPVAEVVPEAEDKTEPPGMALFGDFNIPGDGDGSPPDLPKAEMTNTPQPQDSAGQSGPAAISTRPPGETSQPPRQSTEIPIERAAPPVSQPPAPAGATVSDSELRDALLRGMGLDPARQQSEDPIAEMENLGRCMRDMVEGVMLLLRTRAQEKQKVRVSQTIITSADVNPLKFLATPEDACDALLRPRGKGYLAPDKAVRGAFRDLADHQVRTWSALQTALRRMIDTFDPKEIEKEMVDVGRLESLIAGGRSAKLWQLYEERYRDIAMSAEKQFLGDVGADFRDAYENKGS